MLAAAIIAALVASFATNSIAKPAAGKYFDRYFLVILENTDKDDALADPTFQSVVTNRALNLNNYWAAMHPSQPNYWAIASQNTFLQKIGFNYTTGDEPYNITGVPHIGDALEAAGITWKLYHENYPGDCYLGAKFGSGNFTVTLSNGTQVTAVETNKLYQRKHNPFISFENVYTNRTRCLSHIGNETDLAMDMAAGTLPQYVFYVPNQWNDGHDFFTVPGVKHPTEIQAPYIKSLIPRIQNYTDAFSKRTLFHLTFDEDDVFDGAVRNTTACPDPTNNCPIDVNIVYSALFGSAIDTLNLAGKSTDFYLNHYSIIATLVDNWNLTWTTPDLRGANATIFPLASKLDSSNGTVTMGAAVSTTIGATRKPNAALKNYGCWGVVISAVVAIIASLV